MPERPSPLVLAFLFALASIGAAAAQGQAGAMPEPTLVSSRDLVIRTGEGGAESFRFLPDGEWIAFDRNIVLSAALGESRSYAIEARAGSTRLWSRSYTVDKRPPPRPGAIPGTGVYHSSVALRLECPGSARIYWSLGGEGASAGSFAVYDPADPPRLELREGGSSTYTLAAYAEDDAGNRGAPARFVYRLAPAGMPIASPSPTAPAVLRADPSVPPPVMRESKGKIELEFEARSGARVIAAINPPGKPTTTDDFAAASEETGVARVLIPIPYGWRGELPVYVGVVDGGGARFNPAPIVVRAENSPDPIREPSVPSPPELVVDASGRGASLFFPVYDGELYVSVDGSDPEPYLSPIYLPPGVGDALVGWFGVDADGRRSADGSGVFAVPRPSPEAAVLGAREGAIYGGSVALTAGGARDLRYELRLDGTMPPEPGASSPAFPGELVVACPEGEESSVVLRYRAFDGGYPGESKSLRFVVDRKPPPPPGVALVPPPYTDEARAIDLLRGPADTVFASVSVDGEASPFAPVDAALSLPGRDSGPVSYVVRAYAVDPAGNRSAEMPPVAVVVDRSSIYASSDAPEGGDGSPVRPLRSLDAALALAAKQGKRSVHLRGSFVLTKSFESAAPIEIDGGFAPDWSRKRSERPKVRLASAGPKAALGVVGASLTLRGIDLSSTAAGSPVFAAEDGELRLEECEVAISADGDALLIRAADSAIAIDRSTLRSDRAMSFSGVQATRSDVRLTASSLSASAGVRFFGGFDLEGGSLELDGSLVESSADLGATLLALRASRVSVDRSLFRASGGSGFFRAGSFNESGGEIGNSKFIVSWGGRATLFDVVGLGPAFRHDTIVAEGKKGDLTFFECSGAQPELWNCILTCASGGGTLSKSGIPPAAGVFVADCVYGFDLLSVGASAGASASRIATLAALNALNAGSAAYAAKPCIAEAPLKTFATSMKSVASLSGGSACADAAVSLGGAYARDFRGSPRPSARGSGAPDIGADEVCE